MLTVRASRASSTAAPTLAGQLEANKLHDFILLKVFLCWVILTQVNPTLGGKPAISIAFVPTKEGRRSCS